MIQKNIIRFIFLALLQVLVLNNINFGGFINPYLYVLFLIHLPFITPNWLCITSGFALGLTIDILSVTPGLHTAATVLIAFLRPFIVSLGYQRQDYDSPELSPSLKDFGFRWFFTFSLIIVTIHHLLLFYLEAFNFREFFLTFLKAFMSIFATMILIILSQYLFRRIKKK